MFFSGEDTQTPNDRVCTSYYEVPLIAGLTLIDPDAVDGSLNTNKLRVAVSANLLVLYKARWGHDGISIFDISILLSFIILFHHYVFFIVIYNFVLFLCD